MQRLWWKLKQLALAAWGTYHHSGERVCPEFPDRTFQDHMRVYRFVSQFVRDRVVLDVGCGTGYGGQYLMHKGARCVHGIDYSTEAVAYARNKFQTPHLIFHRMDAHKLSFPDDAFDVVISSENLEHLRDPRRNLAEIRRVLRDGGLLILGTPNKEIASPDTDRSSNPFHVREYTFEELESMLKEHFRSTYILENTQASPSPLGRAMKEQRTTRGKVGIERGGRAQIQLEHLLIDLTHLENTHSFLAIAW
jgi:ubiquinone/menaquinone biosynthesis C-methylase UbiE